MVLTLAILNLKLDKQRGLPDDALLTDIAHKLAEHLGSGKLRENHTAVIAWYRGHVDKVKVAPMRAFVALACYFGRSGLSAAVDRLPNYSEIDKRLLEESNVSEKTMRLSDYQYLRRLSAKPGRVVVVLPARPAGPAELLQSFRFVYLNYPRQDPLVQFRNDVAAVPFRVSPPKTDLTLYDVDAFAIKFERAAEKCTAILQRCVLQLIKSKPVKSESRPAPAAYDNLAKEINSLVPPKENRRGPALPSLPPLASSVCQLATDYQGLTQAIKDYLQSSESQPVPNVPYLYESQGHVILQNPGDFSLLDVKVEYLNSSLDVLGYIEVFVAAQSYEDFTPEAIFQLKHQGALGLRLAASGQFLQLP